MSDNDKKSFFGYAKDTLDYIANTKDRLRQQSLDYLVDQGMNVDDALRAANSVGRKVDRTNLIAQTVGGALYRPVAAAQIAGFAGDLTGSLTDAGRELHTELQDRARGGRLLQDQYPTHYLPHVGRQVMNEGGTPDDVVNQAMALSPQNQDPVSLARSVVQRQPEPTERPLAYAVTPDHRRIMDSNKSKGLQFPEEDGLNRLRLVAARKQKEAEGKSVPGYPANERMVIRAPKDERNLPDFVIGNINFDDWKSRHEKILTKDEIKKASEWYNDVYGEFAKYSSNPQDIKRNMRAWLVANQNATPEESQKNAILQAEQIRRGVPEEQMLKGGLESPTFAARSVIKNEPITGGVGQKIADFVDSAEGKDVRSWMANHPHGGAPFVVDVHTARDTGMVDDTILNHLRRLGYNEEDLGKAKIDLKGPPTEAAYENRAAFGRDLTDHLNDIKWQGKSDWTPAQVQAVGWMGMTKLTRAKEPTAESGLAKNYRRISFEMDPGEGSPWAKAFGERFSALEPQDRYAMTQDITQKAMDAVAPIAGIDVHRLVHGTGGWNRYQNPSAVAQGQIHKTGADIAANALGYLLNQSEVWHNIIKPMTKTPKAFAVDFVEKGSKNLQDQEKLADFWEKLQKADPTGLFEGFQPIEMPNGEVGIRVLISKGGEKTKDRIMSALQGKVEEGSAKKGGNSLHQMIAEMPFDMHATPYEAEITKHGNDWKENPNGEAYLERLGNLIGPDRAAAINSIRQQLEKEIEGHFTRIAQRPQAPQTAPQEVKKAEGGTVHKPHQRAEEQGYSIKGFHVTRGDRARQISSAGRFDLEHALAPGEEAAFFWDNPDAANDWAHSTAGVESFDPQKMSERESDRASRHRTSILPVRINPGKHQEVDWPSFAGTKSYDNRAMAKLISQARDRGIDTLRIKNMQEDEYREQPHDQIAVLSPHLIRSEYAQFNPDRSHEDYLGANRGGEVN